MCDCSDLPREYACQAFHFYCPYEVLPFPGIAATYVRFVITTTTVAGEMQPELFA